MVDSAMTREMILQAVARLPAEHRAVIRRSYYEARTAAQIADDLHIDQRAVRSRLHHGLRALLLELEEDGVTRTEVHPRESKPRSETPREAPAVPDSGDFPAQQEPNASPNH
jgi:hypothetical protein